MSIQKNAKKIIFWGTSYFGAKILEYLINADFQPILVVSTPDSPNGRGLKIEASEVKRMAINHGLEVVQPEKLRDSDFLARFEGLKPDLSIVASYGKIIPKQLLEIPKFGTINVHPSLLPKWRGASPIQSQILSSENEFGTSIMVLDEEMDHGGIISNFQFPIPNGRPTFKELEKKLIEESGKLLIEVLPRILAGEIKPIPQDHSKATFCQMIEKKDGLIDFSESADLIERKIRAFENWPGVWFEKNGKTYKLLEADVFDDQEVLNNKKIGEFFLNNKDLVVRCFDLGLLIKKIQPESKKPLAGYEFWCGYQNKISN